MEKTNSHLNIKRFSLTEIIPTSTMMTDLKVDKHDENDVC